MFCYSVESWISSPIILFVWLEKLGLGKLSPLPDLADFMRLLLLPLALLVGVSAIFETLKFVFGLLLACEIFVTS